MASAASVRWLSPEEYLERERSSEVRSEYHAGETFAMSGGTRAHSLIGGLLVTALNKRLEASGCEVYTSDMRVKIPATGLYTYPDVSVACPPVELEDTQGDTLVNPVLIIEVLSDSTEAYDRGLKFQHYRQLPSLREYLLVSQQAPRVDQFVRGTDGTWVLREAVGRDASLTLSSLGCELSLSEVYAKVELPDGAALHSTPATR